MENFLIILFMVVKCGVCDTCPSETPIRLIKSNPISFSEKGISKSCEIKLIYEIDESYVFDEGKAVRIDISVSTDVPMNCPILVSIFQQKYIVPVILPFSFGSDETIFYEAGRTLCTPSPNNAVANGRNITVHITTCSDSVVQFNLTAQLKDNLLLKEITEESDNRISLTAGPTTPKYMIYKFANTDNKNNSYARINVTSEDNICMIVSIQTIHCPIYEEEVGVKYLSGLYKTMTQSSILDVKQSDPRFFKGFAIVFVVKQDNKECLEFSDHRAGNRIENDNLKHFTVSVEESGAYVVDHQQLAAIFMPILFPVIIIILVLLGHRKHLRYLSESTAYLITNNTEQKNSLVHGNDNDVDLNEVRDEENINQDCIEIRSELSVEQSKLKSLYLNDFNVRLKHTCIVNDNEESLASIKMKRGVARYKKKYNPQDYSSTLLLVAIFYAIPVYELVINFLMTLNIDGDHDFCFYNELCSYHIGPVLDVNHYWSNACYVFLGLAFCIIVKTKGTFLQKLPANKGIAFHNELFCSLGIALMMEGFFSGAYHLCPNKFTFQYDTTFMYVVCSLVLVKLFLSRHPIKHFTASKTYTALVVLVSITAVSYLVDISANKKIKRIFSYVYLTVQSITILFFTIYYCDVGLIKNDQEFGNAKVSPVIIWYRLKYFFCYIFYRSNPTPLAYGEKYPFIWKRTITPFIVMCASIGVFTVLTEKEKGFATVLLFTIVTITMTCTSSYISLKCLNKEFYGEKKKLFIFPGICFTLCIAFGVVAVIFFQKTSYDSDDSPAESRSKNKYCIFLHFYDAHDMWHMLSSISLFIGYMGLLTMDDGMATTSLENISVF